MPSGCLPPVLRESVHGPRDPLPGGSRLRPVRGGALCRRNEDGPLRFGLQRCDVLPGHGIGLPGRGLHHGRLRARGQNVVQGTVDPDEFYVHKPTFKKGHRAVLRRVLGGKQLKMFWADGESREAIRNVPTPAEHRERFCISDGEVLKLADYAIETERHYSALAGHDTPMDMEWAKDGIDGRLYLIQARPETVFSQRRWGFRRWWEPPARRSGSAPRRTLPYAARRESAAGSSGEPFRSRCEGRISAPWSDPSRRSWSMSGIPNSPFAPASCPTTAGPGAHGVHHQRVHQGSSDGASPSRPGRGPPGTRRHRPSDARLPPVGRVSQG